MPPTFFGASDINALYADAGVSVTVGATTVRGIQDSVDEEMLREQFPHLIGRVVTVRVKTGALVLAVNGSITVDGVAYKIHSIAAIDDGAETLVSCVKVT